MAWVGAGWVGGWQVDERDGQGRTALHWACWKGKVRRRRRDGGCSG